MLIRRLSGVCVILLSAICSLRAQDMPITAVIDNRSFGVEHIAKILHGKLNSAINEAGAHSESDRGLYLVGELTPTGEDVVDTGMKKIKTHTYNLSLRIEQPMLNMQFGFLEIPLEGSGVTDIKAAADAVRKFNTSSSTLQSFITASMQKANSYFTNNIRSIIDKANVYARSGDYDAGISLLWACPNFQSIHSQVYSALNRLYVEKQNNECSNLISKANTAYSLKQYDEVATLLNEIDAESACADEAKRLSDKMGAEIRQAEKQVQQREDLRHEREFQGRENERDRNYKLEHRRISAIENVATAYYKSKRDTYHYYIW